MALAYISEFYNIYKYKFIRNKLLNPYQEKDTMERNKLEKTWRETNLIQLPKQKFRKK